MIGEEGVVVGLVGLGLGKGESLDVGDVDGDFVGKFDGIDIEDSEGLADSKEGGNVEGEVLGRCDGDDVGPTVGWLD